MVMDRIWQELEGLGSAAATLTVMSELMDEDRLTVAKILKVCDTDPGLTARVLKRASGALYGRGAPRGVEEATRRLGLLPTRDLLLDSITAKLHPAPEALKTARLTGAVAKTIASVHRKVGPSEAVAAGLLSTIGWALLNRGMGGSMPIEWDGTLPPPERSAREDEVLGITQAALGGEALRRWGFHGALADAVAQHTYELELLMDPLEVVVGCAAWMAWSHESGQPLEESPGLARLVEEVGEAKAEKVLAAAQEALGELG